MILRLQERKGELHRRIEQLYRLSDGGDRGVLAYFALRDMAIAEHLAIQQQHAEILALHAEVKALRARYLALKYSPDQPRDWHGRWTRGGRAGESENGSSIAPDVIHLAGDITGFSKHGINQAINRGVSPAGILDAVNNPLEIILQSDGRRKYIGRNAVVILNASGGVITVWRQ